MQMAELKGITSVSQLATALNWDAPEKLHRLKRTDTARPSFEMLEDFTNTFPDWNIRYLITGEGEPLLVKTLSYSIYPHEEIQEPKTPGRLGSIHPTPHDGRKDKKSVSPTVSPKASLTPQIITVDHSGSENIVYVSVRACAGYLNGYGDPEFVEKLPSFTLPGLRGKSYRAFEVDGDSMYPTLDNKEMVIGEWVESLDHIREDRVHIIVTKNEGVIVKRLLNRIEKYGYIIAKSDAVNDRNLYPNIDIRPEDVLEIWYAVWHGGFSFKSPGDLWKRQNNLEADMTEVLRILRNAGLK